MQVQIQLAIEKGRHQNIARQERFCNKCTMNVLETEYHYLLVCPKFYNLRTKYIKKILLYMANHTQTNTTSIISIEYNCSKCIEIYILCQYN